MGSWNDLDAIYPPGVLSPAAAYLAAFGVVYGLDETCGADGTLHPWLQVAGIPTTADVLTRADAALAGAADIAALVAPLHSGQRLCLALNLLDAVLPSPAQRERRAQLIAALAVDPAVLLVAERLLQQKNDRSVFPQ